MLADSANGLKDDPRALSNTVRTPTAKDCLGNNMRSSNKLCVLTGHCSDSRTKTSFFLFTGGAAAPQTPAFKSAWRPP